MTDLTSLTLAQARDALQNKDFTATELAEAHLSAIERARALNAFVLETPDHARDMARAADKTFESCGGWSFIAVIAAVALKLAAIVRGWGSFYELLFGSLAIGFAAISAAFVGIRSYAELQLLGEQSHHMLDELLQAKARVERIRKDLPRPLAFQDLGAEAQRVAILMLEDLEGWARLFRGKAIEP